MLDYGGRGTSVSILHLASHHICHCVKSVRIRSYSGPYFPASQTEIRTRVTLDTDTFYAVCVL